MSKYGITATREELTEEICEPVIALYLTKDEYITMLIGVRKYLGDTCAEVTRLKKECNTDHRNEMLATAESLKLNILLTQEHLERAE